MTHKLLHVLKVVYAYDDEFHLFKTRDEALAYLDNMTVDKRGRTMYFERYYTDKELDTLRDIMEVYVH